MEKIKMLYTLKEVSDILPKEVKHTPCQEKRYTKPSLYLGDKGNRAVQALEDMTKWKKIP
jgi:hypothetical protein